MVAVSNERLTAIAPKQVDWAVKYLVEHFAFRTANGKSVCADCGHHLDYKEKVWIG